MVWPITQMSANHREDIAFAVPPHAVRPRDMQVILGGPRAPLDALAVWPGRHAWGGRPPWRSGRQPQAATAPHSPCRPRGSAAQAAPARRPPRRARPAGPPRAPPRAPARPRCLPPAACAARRPAASNRCGPGLYGAEPCMRAPRRGPPASVSQARAAYRAWGAVQGAGGKGARARTARRARAAATARPRARCKPTGSASAGTPARRAWTPSAPPPRRPARAAAPSAASPRLPARWSPTLSGRGLCCGMQSVASMRMPGRMSCGRVLTLADQTTRTSGPQQAPPKLPARTWPASAPAAAASSAAECAVSACRAPCSEQRPPY